MNRLRLCTGIGLIVLAGLAAGCQSAGPPAAAPQPAQEEAAAPEPPPTAAPTAAPSPTAETPPTAAPPTPSSALPPLPPDPRPVEFTASDGVTLVGTYFPAAVNPAPIVVLMHWAGGDQADWFAEGLAWPPLALILQNRQGELAGGSGLRARPSLSDGPSYGVLTFNFRGFPPSEGSYGDEYLDARAAVAFARTLEGADPESILTLGASIGADGAVDGCVGPDGAGPACLGAIALSPGSYIGMDFTAAALAVGEMPVACVTTVGDTLSLETCQAAEAHAADSYQAIVYEGDEHGMMLFTLTDQEPPLLDFILEFFSRAVAAGAG